MRKKNITQKTKHDQFIDQLATVIRLETILKQMDKVLDQNDNIVTLPINS
jgi:uncharacterized protein YpiB (UPF0302 family)